jgi:hypothetical protein
MPGINGPIRYGQVTILLCAFRIRWYPVLTKYILGVGMRSLKGKSYMKGFICDMIS